MRVFNLENGQPSACVALNTVKSLISTMKKGEIIVFIHGYGSSGKGGKIRVQVRFWLKAQETSGSLNNVIYGEDFEMFNYKALALKNKDKGLLEYYGQGNQGITIVEK